jgi:hypothetical protein
MAKVCSRTRRMVLLAFLLLAHRSLTTRWRRPGMRRDVQSMVQICYLGRQELERAQAPQLKAVGSDGCAARVKHDCWVANLRSMEIR